MSGADQQPEFDFSKECDQILRNLATSSYEDTIRRVNDLERRALGTNLPENPALSCADLRLDAALVTRQSLAECERRYDELVMSGADATMRLLKACILVRESPSRTASTLEKLSQALEGARDRAPADLLSQAEHLLSSRKP
jgi:hypothetical protein